MIEETNGKVTITLESDIMAARKILRDVTGKLGFTITDKTRIITAASELARNVLVHGGGGLMNWRMIEDGRKVGIELKFEDQGPGISDVEEALQDGSTGGNGMGIGLPGSKRLMDEFEIESQVGKGTTVIIRKWQKKQITK